MNEKKRAQILMLALAVLILAAAGAGWYWIGSRQKAGGNEEAGAGGRAQNSSIAGEAGVTADGGSGGVGLAAGGDFDGAGEGGLAAGGDFDRAGEAGLAAGQEPGGTMGENGNLESGREPGEIRDGLILLEGGTFVMGSPEGERQREPDEVSHEVEISAFYINPFEVTQRDYEAVMGKNPSYFQGENLPVDSVTWYEAAEYCNRLSEARGLTPVYTIGDRTVTWDRSANGYRLLTEAEWEYAARAGSDTVFNPGNQITSDNANFQGSYPYLIEENYVSRKNPEVVTSQNRGQTIEVDSLSPNEFGLYNMHGNVSEWCFDYYGAYDLEGTADPEGARRGSLRVNRGGGFNDFAKHLRSAYRSAANPIDGDENLGFRIGRNGAAGEGIVETAYSLDIEMPENPRILIAYFSYSGNTENGARIIREKTGADLVEIEMETPYRGNIYEVSQADLNGNVRPRLTTCVENMDEYDVVLLGYPTWWATMPMPVVSFVEQYDFAGKIVIPFSSHGGTIFGDSVSDLSKLVPDSYVGIGFEFNYSGGRDLEERISQWLASSGIREQ